MNNYLEKGYILESEEEIMANWICTVCGYVYDEEKEGKPFEDLPESWVCPECGVGKDLFEKM